MRVWSGAVACFVVAAAAGTLFRFGPLTGLPWGLEAGNLRHAHSHLMFFSWATPALMALWACYVQGKVKRLSKAPGSLGRGGYLAAWAAMALGLFSFPFFLVAGYGRVAFLGARLPWATMISGVTMFAWYSFGIWYVRIRPKLPRTPALALFEISLLALGVSTLGAWGRAAFQVMGGGSPMLEELSVQLFLGAFTHGWLIVGTLGLAAASVEDQRPLRLGGAPWLLLLGLPGASLMGRARMVGEGLGLGYQMGIALSALVFAAGLGWCAWRLVDAIPKGGAGWWPYLVFLLLTLVSLALSAIPPVIAWAERAGLYIVYLHLLALGVASTGLVAAARERWGAGVAPSPWSFGGSVALLLLGVISLTPLWPGSADPAGRLAFAAGTSIPPVAAMLLPWFRESIRGRV